MTFRDYIVTIANAKIFNGSRPKLVAQLFKDAAAITPVEEETAKGWLRPEGSKGYRNCRIKEYFPNDKVNYENGFIKFFSSRLSWKKLQKEFGSKEPSQLMGDDFVVNLETNQPALFYWSLLNQFQRIFNFPLTKMPVTDINNEEDMPQIGVTQSNTIKENATSQGGTLPALIQKLHDIIDSLSSMLENVNNNPASLDDPEDDPDILMRENFLWIMRSNNILNYISCQISPYYLVLGKEREEKINDFIVDINKEIIKEFEDCSDNHNSRGMYRLIQGFLSNMEAYTISMALMCGKAVVPHNAPTEKEIEDEFYSLIYLMNVICDADIQLIRSGFAAPPSQSLI